MLRKLLALVFIFLVFYLGAHFYIRWRHTVSDDVTKIGRLVECQPNEVRAIHIQQLSNGIADELTFERTDHPDSGIPAVAAVARWQWKMTTPAPGEADPTLLRRIASDFCELYDPIPLRAGDFQPETATRRLGRRLDVTLNLPAGGKTASLEFGAMGNGTNLIRYQAHAYRIPEHLLEAISLPVEDYRNRRVMRTEADNVQQATLTIDGKERFSLERAGADWAVLLGGKGKGEGSEEADKFVNRVSTLRAIGIEAEDFSTADCAALKAKAVVAARDVTGKSEEVRFQYGPHGDVIACSSNGTQKFKVHRDMIPFLDVPLKTMLKKK